MREVKIHKTDPFAVDRSAKMEVVERYKTGIHDPYEGERQRRVLMCEASKLEEMLDVADRSLSRWPSNS
jgi:hypothetical protein